jgi:hypothetical protein
MLQWTSGASTVEPAQFKWGVSDKLQQSDRCRIDDTKRNETRDDARTHSYLSRRKQRDELSPFPIHE